MLLDRIRIKDYQNIWNRQIVKIQKQREVELMKISCRWYLQMIIEGFFCILPVLHQFCQLYSQHDLSYHDSHHSQLLHCSSFTQKPWCPKTYKYQNRHSVSIGTIKIHNDLFQSTFKMFFQIPPNFLVNQFFIKLILKSLSLVCLNYWWQVTLCHESLASWFNHYRHQKIMANFSN